MDEDEKRDQELREEEDSSPEAFARAWDAIPTFSSTLPPASGGYGRSGR
jgi:hypothetical protein